MNIAELVRETREKKGWSQTRLAEEAGISQQAVTQIETGATKAPTNSWRRIASALEIPEELFAELMRDAQRGARRERGGATVRYPAVGGGLLHTAPPMPVRPYRKIPVLGRVAGSPFGEGHLIMNQTVDQTDCPPWIDDAVDSYALYVVGASMIPRFYPGEMVFVHPWKQPRPDDFVVAQIRDPNTDDIFGYVKQFIGFDKKGLRLRQFNPKLEDLAPFPAGDVHALHKIIIPGLG
ncbi:MAG: Repressor protein [Microvirga sp.]|jgi:SOS-response transcriptional repressor LexA|nr:Repressor protein [Microvirga sp.]